MPHTDSSDRRNFGFDSHQFMLGLLYKSEIEACWTNVTEFEDLQLTTPDGTEYEEWRHWYVINFELRDYEGALDWVEMFDWDKEIFAGSHLYWLYRGWCMVELGRSDDALLNLQKYRAIETDPILRSSASLGLARIYFSEGKTTQALDELDSVLNTAPDDPFTREQVGKIILDHWINVIDSIRAEGQYREKFKQLELFARPSQAADNPHLSWIYQACCEQGLGSLEEALTCLGDYISDESDPVLSTYASISLALTYWLEVKNAKVLSEAGFLTMDVAAYIDLRMNRSLSSARNYLSAGRMIEARAEIEFIRTNIPFGQLEHFELREEAESLFMECWDSEYDQLFDMGLYFEAFKWVESYNWEEDCPFGPQNRWLYRAWCEKHLGWTDEAITNYGKYIALETDPLCRSIVSTGLAQMYSYEGQYSEAVEAMNAALNDAPDDPWVKEQAKDIQDDFKDWFGGLVLASILLSIKGYQIVGNNS